MRSILVAVFCVFSLCVNANELLAEVITIEGTIKSVDAKKRTITVKTKTKTLELDVSRKAKINTKGKKAKLDALKPGQKVKLSYHDDLEIVLKIESERTVGKSARPIFVEVSELNESHSNAFPWISPDGLVIHWERDNSIWLAHRKNQDSPFEGQQYLFPGRHPTLTSDGFEMVFVIKNTDGTPGVSLQFSRRNSVNGKFLLPKPIRELRNMSDRYPCFSANGLKLYFSRRKPNGPGIELAVSSRQSRNAHWGPPKTLPIMKKTVSGYFTWPHVIDDGLTLFCTNAGTNRLEQGQGNLMMWTRRSANAAFRKFTYIDLPGMEPLVGRSPRYVPATKELFVTISTGPRQWAIWVVKNFDPSKFEK